MTAIPKNRDIVLGDRTFSVPPLPIRINRVVYPICRKLVMDDLLKRCIDAGGELVATAKSLISSSRSPSSLRVRRTALSPRSSSTSSQSPPAVARCVLHPALPDRCLGRGPQPARRPRREDVPGKPRGTAPTDRLQRATGAAGPLFRAEPDYWLDTCTLHDWNTIWCRELINTPPVDQIAAAYVGYKAPHLDDQVPGDDDHLDEWECPFRM
jgi:hypothetical protein